MRYPKAIRLDESDAHVFERAAEPGECVVVGSFVFADDEPEAIAGKRRQAFRNGFLGIGSFGWSTLAVVAEIDEATFDAAVERLADRLEATFGAPSRAAAVAAAREEAGFAASLCNWPVNTVIALDREFGEGGYRRAFSDGRKARRRIGGAGLGGPTRRDVRTALRSWRRLA